VALEKGYFQEQGLKAVATPFESGTLVVDALIAGRIDISSGNSIVTNWMANRISPELSKSFWFMVSQNLRITPLH